MKIDPIVKKETGFMAVGSLICTAILVLGFFFFGKLDTSVVLGCLIGYLLTVGNFFIMSYTLSKAIATGDEVTAKLKMKQSYVTRSVIMLVVMAVTIVVDWIHWVPVVASVFYPRIVIFVRGICQNVRPGQKFAESEGPKEEHGKEYVRWEDDGEETDEFEKFVGGFSKSPAPRGNGKSSADHTDEKKE